MRPHGHHRPPSPALARDVPDDIAIVGRSCRLPGAASVAAFWRLLVEGRCAVTSIPASRWDLAQRHHPRIAERGSTYTWAAGVLDDIWGFDPGVFGISPREAEQMDPQQRLLLELAWEALEDAGIRPSRLAGRDVGVFVGASAVDHANLRMLDMAAADAYMMTGNTLSILANRLSHVFDLHGPSFTVDTACSSSLVAVDEAVASLRRGRIDTALVAGVNILASPQSFVGFSQAAMLSKRGLCQPFSADADGYVRAEGGVVLVLKTRAAAEADGDPVHGLIADSDVNSDGRTNGVSLPSATFQARLLDALYRRRGVDPNALAFVEAHGTGTPVGDPIEAAALGEALARGRQAPLLIGSAKSNVGHLESASGLVGVLKAMLALEHDQLPASLHGDTLNPAIDFDGLNLSLARALTPLARMRGTRRLAGVNSFGIGGTNAHVILADAPPAPDVSVAATPSYLVLSAHSRAALAALMTDYAARLAASDDAAATALLAATARRRDHFARRVVLPVGDRGRLAAALDALRDEDREVASAARGTAVQRDARVAFVFSGNGSQFAGMGLAAYARSPIFRARLDEMSEVFSALAGWSLVETLHAHDLATRLARTRIAQPLLFAIQSAACHALRQHGLEPDFVIGHSVGEVAAAEAAGILDRDDALRVIAARSLHQERVFDRGGMAVVIGSRDATDAMLAEVPGLSIAAFNSPRAFTVSGRKDEIARLSDLGRVHRARVRRLDLAYPFHGAGMAPVEGPLLADLAGLAPRASRIPFLSTVTGAAVAGCEVDASYWWRNVREPVRFSDAIAAAAAQGARIFVEIGPMATLLSHIHDTIDERTATIATMAALDKGDKGADPLAMTVATAIARGAKVDERKAYGSGPGPGAHVPLPSYPWQRQMFRLPETSEALGVRHATAWHPLIGARLGPDQFEWRSALDTTRVPSLADHRLDGRAMLSGAAFAEMAAAVARDWLGHDQQMVRDLEIVSPMPLSADAAREVACRLSPAINQLEIASRARFSQAGWQIHATAKIIRDPSIGTLPEIADPVPRRWVAGADVYAMAERAGFDFGPAYRKLERAVAIRPDRLLFDLAGEAADPVFGLDPARLDSCFHALILLFATPGGTAYVPVRFGTIVVRRPGIAFTRGRIDVTRRDARRIIADLVMTDAAGDVVAIIREARFQATRTAAVAAVAPRGAQTLILASEPAAARRDPPLAPAKLRQHIARVDPRTPPADDYMLLEGWTTALALRVARDLSTDHVVDLDALIATRRLPATLRPWFAAVLGALHRSGLCDGGRSNVRIDPAVSLPEPDAILRTLAHEHPALSAELLAASSALLAVDAIIRDGAAGPMSPRVIDNLETGSSAVRAAADALMGFVRASVGAWPKDRAIRILQIGSGPLTRHAVALARDLDARLTILDPDRVRLERTRMLFSDLRDLDALARIEADSPARFDLVIAAAALGPHTPRADIWMGLRRAMAPDAIFAAIEPMPSFFRDFVLGLAAGLAEECAAPAQAPGPRDWREGMRLAGLEDIAVEHVATGLGPALLLTGQVGAVRKHWVGAGSALVVGDESCRAHTSFATLLASAGLHVSIARDDAIDEACLAARPGVVVVFARDADEPEAPATRVLDQCLRLKRLVDGLGQTATRLWLVTSGAVAGGDHRASDIAAALWAFSRTLANEVPSLDIRRVDVAGGARPGFLAARLRDLVLSETDETEIVIGEAATHVVRFVQEPGRQEPGRIDREDGQGGAARLMRGDGSGLDRMVWGPVRRPSPGRGAVEIAVEASGLNFRDVMLGLGLLPEAVLDDGFAGPNPGLECAGRITRVGAGVKGLKRGDRVMAFARNAFATHVTTPASLVALLPEATPMAAAATVPVAFLTAFYGLITCAGLKSGEWVLIHGAAGGVGLAALQIARWRGARVIATAGSPEKRALLRSLGADHVCDSRSGAFVDDVRETTGLGVAVVLNSLSGEAMERSIATLRPFGRFIELGKRDYVTNTHVGLRPFRSNLTYRGVDLDQLLAGKPAMARRLMRSVTRLFAEGDIGPLPYRVFEADEMAEAFRQMRQAAHVGKIVVRPPQVPVLAGRRGTRFKAAADTLHLVTGGFGGFGLETARWLADQGARHIMLLGRRGAATEGARAAMAALAARGVHVEAQAGDVTDRPALERLFARFGRDLPPLAGVIHAAMALDDASLATLSAERMERVLAPKVTGAHYLDQLTRGTPLDYFILYSSATTLLGNPGQAAYVAANGFLEGLARRRRRAGLPGLAVAWGAIADVGVLSRSPATRERLAARAGVEGLKARDALRSLGAILASGSLAPEDAVVVVAPIDWPVARQAMPLLRSPMFGLMAGRDPPSESTGQVDIAALVAAISPDAARQRLSTLVADEIGRVLRLPRDDVARTIPLSEIGLDSLMTVELALGLANRLTLKAPLSTHVGGLTVNEIVDHLIAEETSPSRGDAVLARTMVDRHLGTREDEGAIDALVQSAEEAAVDRRRDAAGSRHGRSGDAVVLDRQGFLPRGRPPPPCSAWSPSPALRAGEDTRGIMEAISSPAQRGRGTTRRVVEGATAASTSQSTR